MKLWRAKAVRDDIINGWTPINVEELWVPVHKSLKGEVR